MEERPPALSSPAVGALVQRALATGEQDLARLVRDDERLAIPDVHALVASAEAVLAHLRRAPETADLFGTSEAIVWRGHEVPFSLRGADGVVVRGTIDLVVQRADGVVEVLELKTGRPAREHEEQLALYVDAARRLFPDARVEGRVIYASAPEATFHAERRLT